MALVRGDKKMSDDLAQQQKRMFQKIKGMTQAQFNHHIIFLFDHYYGMAVEHYGLAMGIELQPKQREKVEAKAKQIREEWDGIF
jgi:dimeric dUTPase (all-alpha-NTP-PPase superfamily)